VYLTHRTHAPPARPPASPHDAQALPLELAQRIADDAADTMDAQAQIDAAFAQLVGVGVVDDVASDASLVAELEMMTAASEAAAAAAAAGGGAGGRSRVAGAAAVATTAAAATAAGRRESSSTGGEPAGGALTAAAFPAVPAGRPQAAAAAAAEAEAGAVAAKRQRVAVSA
jgi:hypothetical protein